MRLVTLGQLKTDVIEQADLVSVGADTFITDTLLTRWIAQSSRRFAGLLASAYGGHYEDASATFTTANDQARYTLSSIGALDMFQLYAVSIRKDGADYNIYPASYEDLGHAETSDNTDHEHTPRYRWLGDEIELTPVPTSAYEVKLRYITTDIARTAIGVAQLDLVNDTDTLDGINGWEQWIVWDVCVKAKAKQDEDPSIFMAERAQIEAEIKRQARRRDRGPRFVRRTYDGPGAADSLGFPRRWR